MTPGSSVRIHKLDAQGLEQWGYEGRILEESGAAIVVEAIFDRDDVEIEGLQLRRGDRFIEKFYVDRWYNIFAIHDGKSGLFKGWYCNITRPARRETGHIYAEDLALDLIIFPDYRWRILDQDEFDALVLPEDDRRRALRAVDDLIAMAEGVTGPFKQTG